MESISVSSARRLALARAGLLKPAWTDFPTSARGAGKAARAAAHRLIDRFGYLQLDTVPVAGARSHVLVLMSRFETMNPVLGEDLLQPEEPLFEYWGHEASWLPMNLYGAFAFRRTAFQRHPWWGDVIAENKGVAKKLLRRIRDEGAMRSVDMDGPGGRGWWDFKIAKKVATALWSTGELAIRERNNFIRAYDLADRVIPATARAQKLDLKAALRVLLLRALDGHGWATKGTLASTWRLRNMGKEISAALADLVSAGDVVRCELAAGDGKPVAGFVRSRDLELADRLRRVRPREDIGVLLSPFDPVLWDRPRVKALFDFDQVLEIYKPAAQRIYGYYCLPVLAGDRLIGRVDLKADKKNGRLNVLSRHFEARRPSASAKQAMTTALERHSRTLELALR